MVLSAQTKDTLSFENVHKIYKEKDYETALQGCLQLSERYTKESNKPMLAKTFNIMGLIFKKNKNYTKAKYYYFKALKAHNQGETKLLLLLNIASLNYQEQHNDSTVYYYQNILKDSSFIKYKEKIAETHKNLSGIYIVQGKNTLALKHLNIAKKYYKTNSKPIDLINLYNNLAGIYYKEKDYNNAILDYQKAYQLFDATTPLNYQYAISENLSKCNFYIGNFKEASKHDSIANKLQDSLYALEYNAKITEIEAIHNEDKARAEEALNTEQQREAKQRTQYALAGTGLVSLIIILIGTILYRNSKLKAKTLSLTLVEQELNQQKTLRVLEERNQSKLLNATLDGRETERKDIAQTLHDSVSALLSSANMHLQVAKKKSTSSVEELEKSQRIIDEASGKVRDLSHKLISAVLLKFGLEHAVYDMCEKYSNSSLEFELESEDKIPRFEQNFEIKLHNIIQECINNIIKHSKATEASVFLLYTNNTLNVVIKDNGVGFDVSKISPSSGIGLSQIKARIENLGGEFVITSSRDIGTEINFKVPVNLLKLKHP